MKTENANRRVRVTNGYGSYIAEVLLLEDNGYYQVKNVKTGATWLEHESSMTSIFLYRNQGLREGIIIARTATEYLVEYKMPKGTTALIVISAGNLTKDVVEFPCDIGGSITYHQLIKDFCGWRSLLKPEAVYVIANPQQWKQPEAGLFELRQINETDLERADLND